MCTTTYNLCYCRRLGVMKMTSTRGRFWCYTDYGGTVRHEADRFPTLIPQWPSIDLLEFAYILRWLSTHPPHDFTRATLASTCISYRRVSVCLSVTIDSRFYW